MIRYLIDTNGMIALMGGRSEALMRRVEASQPGSIATSAIVAHELFFGAFQSTQVDRNLETLRLAFVDIGVLDYDREDARTAGEIRADLKRKGTPIGPYDLLIAGQAKARNLTVITNNTREFVRVPGLRVEDWSIG